MTQQVLEIEQLPLAVGQVKRESKTRIQGCKGGEFTSAGREN